MKNNKKTPIILIILFAVLIVIVVVILVFSKGKQERVPGREDHDPAQTTESYPGDDGEKTTDDNGDPITDNDAGLEIMDDEFLITIEDNEAVDGF